MVYYDKKQAGVASITVVIFMSIILTIVTIGFIRIAVNESRNSTDEDQTSRAYYAAESGLEDAKRAIGANLAGTFPITSLNSTTCSPPVGYSPVLSQPSEFDIAYTCMLIDYTPGIVQVKASSANQSKQFEVTPINQISNAANALDIGTITISWHKDAPIAIGGDGNVSVGGPIKIRPASALLPALSTWEYPAMMEVSFITHPGGSFARGDIKSSTVYISPNAGSGNATIYGAGGVINSSVDGSIVAGNCADNDNNMACSMTFDVSSMNSTDLLDLRITNLYAPTSYSLSMENTSGQTLLFDGVQAVVDVTGRAGEVYRRVEAALDLSSPELLPDYAVQSATDICKDFTFTTLKSDFDAINSTSCTR